MKKTWIRGILIFCILVMLAPIPADAVTRLTQPMETVTVINPMYEGLISITPPRQEDVAGLCSVEKDSYATTYAEAGGMLLEGLLKREEGILVYFRTDSGATVKEITQEILNAAVAHNGDPVCGDYIQRQLGGYSVSSWGYSSGSCKYYTFQYNMNYLTTAEQEAEMDIAVAELLASLDLDGKSEYEQVYTIYRWMCENITYDYGNLADPEYLQKFTAYAALIDRTSVCQGYAVLLYRLCLERGIDCRVIVGTGNGGGHAWNIVKLNGRYYNADATWDASYFSVFGRFRYFLRCEENFQDHSRDEEFATEAFHAEYPMGETDFDPNALPPVIAGDINGDCALDNKDLSRLFQYLSGWEVTVSDNSQDINGDGSVNNKDLTRLFQYLSGWDVEIH